ncbi:NAD(P)-binding domain-containing protein [Antrihabitans sp. YC3-6]|uniref:NAD(P)-binding domain-containing protein n=1 Tax=Antrihabitans stalagmiti TaxID=2799499 RepID=A0A934NWR5_9NOCA|nr:NAD(P)-binding domain-containing protein [Antrihabitans stalagmiti]MBJ8342683.1 NAD(P)-binding domain-containing protein [Antrihabitans stalagmiti]
MTTIGFIGAGNIGGTVARLAVKAGYDVVVSNSRGPETLASLVAELGARARAATPAGAASGADIVVVTIPLRNIDQLPVEDLAGKTIIDTNNYYPARDGQIPRLDSGEATVSELLQELLPSARVVKGFNNIYFGHLATLGRPNAAADRSALPIAGNSDDAKTEVTAFLDAIGYDAVDAGPLAEGWRYEVDRPAYGLQYAAEPQAFQGVPGFSLEAARSAGVDEVAALVAQATR